MIVRMGIWSLVLPRNSGSQCGTHLRVLPLVWRRAGLIHCLRTAGARQCSLPRTSGLLYLHARWSLEI